jgi:hypothetical protein
MVRVATYASPARRQFERLLGAEDKPRLSEADKLTAQATKAQVRALLAKKRAISHMKATLGR